VLLREYVGARLAHRRRRPARRPQMIDREPPNRYILLLERYLPRRIGLVATLAILFGSLGFGIVRGGHLEEFTTALSDTRNALANSAGFRITTVGINGRKQLSQD